MVSFTSGSSVIEINNAVKDYGGNKRIGPVNLTIRKGEIVGFLGPNGSGKTTTIRQILGLIKPSEGTVKVNGYNPITHHVQALKGVAYSPELPNIQTFLNPKQFLNLISHELTFPSSSSRQVEISRILELVGLREYAQTSVGKLSKGMVQRLSIAQALIGHPQTLILDEPMIGLDPAGVAHFREVFKDFSAHQNGTVFMSSHIMSEVESLCTSVAIIHHGKVLFRGPVAEVIKEALNYSVVHLETSPLSIQTIQQLRELTGVNEVNKIESADESIESLEVIIRKQDLDIRPQLSSLIVNSGARLYTIKPAENMLEKAYIEALKGSGSK
jgi:ABC-2 type transport system ATP-binding protein